MPLKETEMKTKSKAVCSNQETACYLAQQITEWLCRFVCHQRNNETDDVAGATRSSSSSQIDLSPIQLVSYPILQPLADVRRGHFDPLTKHPRSCPLSLHPPVRNPPPLGPGHTGHTPNPPPLPRNPTAVLLAPGVQLDPKMPKHPTAGNVRA